MDEDKGCLVMDIVFKLRKIMGRRGISLVRRMYAGLAKTLRIIDPPSKYRPPGISALIVSYNEEDWIEDSMESISELIDEYVVVDSSTDSTPEKARRKAKELGKPLKLIRAPRGNLAELRNLGLRKTSYRWILVWDPDFILHEKYVDYLKSLVHRLALTDWYYGVYWPHVCLDIDIKHYDPRNYLQREHWLFTYHPSLQYKIINHLERLVLPLFYIRIDIEQPLSFHLRTVKKPVRLLYRHYWYKALWADMADRINLDEYVKMNIREDFGTSSIEEAALKYVEMRLKKLSEYKGVPLPYSKYLLKRMGNNRQKHG
ncbi:MAG: glycosyltransferase family 2 protein [Crenarchaeota archaeon]|nr:glycosyltransferase family 2 protein [Thermoproteota archaeon]